MKTNEVVDATQISSKTTWGLLGKLDVTALRSFEADWAK